LQFDIILEQIQQNPVKVKLFFKLHKLYLSLYRLAREELISIYETPSSVIRKASILHLIPKVGI